MRTTLVLFTLLSIAALLSCGGAPDLPPGSQVTLTLTPLAATVHVNGTVNLQGSIAGLSAPTLDWWMQEQHDRNINGSEDCDQITTINQSLIANCSYGYLTGDGMIQALSTSATFHAPATPGTYHVTLRGFQNSSVQWGEWVEKRATATITVTP